MADGAFSPLHGSVLDQLLDPRCRLVAYVGAPRVVEFDVIGSGFH